MNLRTLLVRSFSSSSDSQHFSTSSWNTFQSTPFLFHLPSLPNTAWCVILVFTTKVIGMWSERPIWFPTFHVHLFFHLLPTRETSGVLSVKVMRSILVGVPSLSTVRLLAMIQSYMASSIWVECKVPQGRMSIEIS